MLFRPALFLALVALAIARPNPSSLKTIASASGSKSSIKSPSQKLAEKNSSPSVAAIVEPVQTTGQSENLSVNLPQATGQDSDTGLQYSQDLTHQASKVVPTVVNKPESVAAPSSSVQNEVVKPSTYSNVGQPIVEAVQDKPVHDAPVHPVATVVEPVVNSAPIVPVEPVSAPVEPVVVKEVPVETPVVQTAPVHPVVVEAKPVVSEPVAQPVVQSAPVVESKTPVEKVAYTPVVSEVVAHPVEPVSAPIQPVVDPAILNSQAAPVEAPVHPIVVESVKPVVATDVQPVVQHQPVVTEVKSEVKSEVQHAPPKVPIVVESKPVESVVEHPIVPDVAVEHQATVVKPVEAHSEPVVESVKPVVVESVKPVEAHSEPVVESVKPVVVTPVVAEQAVPQVVPVVENKPVVETVHPAVSSISTV